MAEDPSSSRFKDTPAGLTVAVIIKDSVWQKTIPPLESLAREAVAEVLSKAPIWKAKQLPAGRSVEVSLCFADDEFVAGLNREFRDQDKPTNVLSFPGTDPEDYQASGEILLGDIVFAFGVVSKEAKDQQKSMNDHTTHLIVHGLLHLLGYTHDDDVAAAEMETLEIEILKGFGIDNPYR